MALGLSLIALSIAIVGQAGAGDLPPGFVRLGSIDPSIRQEMRYATPDNFVGRPIPGYEAGECWLRREVADALSRVQLFLAKHGLGLTVYDCYRPIRAVRYFSKWSKNPSDQGRKSIHYPSVDKSTLFESGYLAGASSHSKGIAVDVGLVRRSAAGRKDDALDLGTPFDFLDPSARTGSTAVSSDARQYRLVLVAAMAKYGFRNYWREWWHFSFGELRNVESFDVPIRP
jgi:D-alanyl-D-alanine dipeptidase